MMPRGWLPIDLAEVTERLITDTNSKIDGWTDALQDLPIGLFDDELT